MVVLEGMTGNNEVVSKLNKVSYIQHFDARLFISVFSVATSTDFRADMWSPQ